MTNEANDIFTQAKNGSVAAIIQVLNEKLTDSGVRTRAIFADGMLQLLCEGQTLDQLEQPVLVERIRYLLENISPRNIRRVNIYCRIVCEQQLLWLDEINRDRDNVLWSEEISLKQPNLLKRLQGNWASRTWIAVPADRTKPTATRSRHTLREQRQFWRGLVGGTAVSCILLVAGWWLLQQYGAALLFQSDPSTAKHSPSPVTPPQSQPVSNTSDPFANAVRLAERTSRSSATAKTTAEWLNLAAQWQQAAEFMAAVPATDQRYKTAQDRVSSYQKNSDVALQKAKQNQPSEISN